jgi:hypothetical protein
MSAYRDGKGTKEAQIQVKKFPLDPIPYLEILEMPIFYMRYSKASINHRT